MDSDIFNALARVQPPSTKGSNRCTGGRQRTNAERFGDNAAADFVDSAARTFASERKAKFGGD